MQIRLVNAARSRIHGTIVRLPSHGEAQDFLLRVIPVVGYKWLARRLIGGTFIVSMERIQAQMRKEARRNTDHVFRSRVPQRCGLKERASRGERKGPRTLFPPAV